MYCRNCGQHIEADSRFCRFCGSPQTIDAGAASASPAPPPPAPAPPATPPAGYTPPAFTPPPQMPYAVPSPPMPPPASYGIPTPPPQYQMCEITWKRQAHGFTTEQWFEAVTMSTLGVHVLAKSMPFKGPTAMIGKTVVPQQNEASTNALNELIRTLTANGWEQTMMYGEFWFSMRLQLVPR